MGGLMGPVTCIAITSNDAFVAVACEDETSLSRSFDANRVIAHLSKRAQLPILCLHHTPAGPDLAKERRRSARAHSISSAGSNLSESKKRLNGQHRRTKKIKIPNFTGRKGSKHRLPVPVAAPAQKSNTCGIL
ncbi:unnamed protein product, partial [Mesorhabditis belari]|uniref:Uncharacterized protein n=1 Tax=Mesorhabditis belari TaxID=2138241 RepID=A0AAF3EHV9_9BILA